MDRATNRATSYRTHAGTWIIMGLFTMVLGGCQSVTKNEAFPTQQLTAIDSPSETLVESKKAALVNVELGLGYLSQGQVARAKTKLNHALTLAPKATETHSALAYFLEKVGENDRAEAEHKKAMNYGKNEAAGTVYNNYGAFLCRQGRYKEADHAFQQALEDKQYPRTAEVYENAGLCALKGPTKDKAEGYFLNAIRQDPKRSNALLELTDLSLKQHNFEVAKNTLAHYKQVAEPSARSLWLGIQLANSMNDEVGVKAQVLMLKNLFEDSPEYQQYVKSGLESS